MKNIIYIIAVLMISSCATQNKCDRKFPCTGKDSISVITKTETIYRDTIIYVYVPGEKVTETKLVYVDANGIMHSDISKLYTSFAESWAWVENGKLMHELMQKDTTLARHIKNAIKESAMTTETVKIKTVIQEVNRVTGWQWFQIWAGRILLLIILIFSIWWTIKFLSFH
jgi:hypothetical protein